VRHQQGYSDNSSKAAITPLNTCSARGDCIQRPITVPNSVHTLMHGKFTTSITTVPSNRLGQ